MMLTGGVSGCDLFALVGEGCRRCRFKLLLLFVLIGEDNVSVATGFEFRSEQSDS